MDQLNGAPEELDRAGLEERQLNRLQSLLGEIAKSNGFWQERLANIWQSGDWNFVVDSLDDELQASGEKPA